MATHISIENSRHVVHQLLLGVASELQESSNVTGEVVSDAIDDLRKAQDLLQAMLSELDDSEAV